MHWGNQFKLLGNRVVTAHKQAIAWKARQSIGLARLGNRLVMSAKTQEQLIGRYSNCLDRSMTGEPIVLKWQ